jgi:glycosyltransferase involved in cell wall biosynthesis
MRLSIVVPSFNEGENIDLLWREISLLEFPEGFDVELIFVDDGSIDDTASRVQTISSSSSGECVKLVQFSRNFGKEAAITAGLAYSSGDYVAVMDADLQHPPEYLLPMLDMLLGGADVVVGVRQDRSSDGVLRRFFTRAFYSIINSLSKVEISDGAGDFRMMRRDVVDALLSLPERNRFMKGIYPWVGFRIAEVPVHLPDRQAGESKFNFLSLFRFAIIGITGFSVQPLRLTVLLGLVVAFSVFVYGMFEVVSALVSGVSVPGYASTIALLSLVSGVQILVLGVVGEYLARVFDEVKGRPLYIVMKKIGFSDE